MIDFQGVFSLDMGGSRVSVVVPCYKSELYIGRALDSIMAQSYKPYEIILIDDSSGDNSIANLRSIILKYPNAFNISLITLDQNRGAGNARNIGWDRAIGEFIAFLDSDDSWHPRKLEIQLAFFNQNKNVDLVGGLSGRYYEDESNLMPKLGDLEFTEVKFNELLYGNPIHISSAMIRSGIPIRFVDNQRYMEDHRFLLELSANNFCIYKCQNNLSTYYKFPYGDFGLSSSLWLMEKYEIVNFLWAFQRGFIGICNLLFSLLFSAFRFTRRCILVIIRRTIISYCFL